MFTKEWKAEYKGHKIIVSNKWGILSLKDNSAKLYIDGECVDVCYDLIATDKTPSLRGSIKDKESIHLVEVYVKSGLFQVKSKILVDEVKVAGDLD
jgi:hypothetical protein